MTRLSFLRSQHAELFADKKRRVQSCMEIKALTTMKFQAWYCCVQLWNKTAVFHTKAAALISTFLFEFSMYKNFFNSASYLLAGMKIKMTEFNIFAPTLHQELQVLEKPSGQQITSMSSLPGISSKYSYAFHIYSL